MFLKDMQTLAIGVLKSTYEFTFSLSSSPLFWTVLSVNSSKLTNSDFLWSIFVISDTIVDLSLYITCSLNITFLLLMIFCFVHPKTYNHITIVNEKTYFWLCIKFTTSIRINMNIRNTTKNFLNVKTSPLYRSKPPQEVWIPWELMVLNDYSL